MSQEEKKTSKADFTSKIVSYWARNQWWLGGKGPKHPKRPMDAMTRKEFIEATSR